MLIELDAEPFSAASQGYDPLLSGAICGFFVGLRAAGFLFDLRQQNAMKSDIVTKYFKIKQ